MDSSNKRKEPPKKSRKRKKVTFTELPIKKQFRQKDERMKNIIDDIEEEIENQLSVKAERNKLTTTNVKTILKAVIMDEDVKEMLRQTLHPEDNTTCLYEPKLTRAKIKELLKIRPELSLPLLPIVPLKQTNFVSECLSLINNDYAESSSEDEEYKPEDDEDGSEDDADTIYSGVASDIELEQAALHSSVFDQSLNKSVNVPAEENIGQRTRSKFPLTDTPLEVIEQAFVPPDITEDMYDTGCGTEEWGSFLHGLYQPLNVIENEHNDDAEDDPEYNILADEETLDREEFRKDKAVKVSRKEFNELIEELNLDEFVFMSEPRGELVHTVEEAETTELPETVETEAVEEQLMCHIEPDTFQTSNDVESEQVPPMSFAQRLLLDQQMRQHVQLCTGHFIQTYKHEILYPYASQFQQMLKEMKYLAGDKIRTAFQAINLDDALKLCEKWEKINSNVPAPTHFSLHKRTRSCVKFCTKMARIFCESSVFLYPLMLPLKPFSLQQFSRRCDHHKLLPSEEKLLAIGIENFVKLAKKKSNKESAVLLETMKLVHQYLLPISNPKMLERFVHQKLRSAEDNPIKYVFRTGRAQPEIHRIIPIAIKPPCAQPAELLPKNWDNYICANYVTITK